MIRNAIERILGFPMDDPTFAQACLTPRLDGLGLRKVVDDRRVDTPDCTIQHQHAEHLDPRHGFADHVRHAGRGLVMVLENEAAHPAVLGELREVNHVNRARPLAGVVGIGMGVYVNHAR